MCSTVAKLWCLGRLVNMLICVCVFLEHSFHMKVHYVASGLLYVTVSINKGGRKDPFFSFLTLFRSLAHRKKISSCIKHTKLTHTHTYKCTYRKDCPISPSNKWTHSLSLQGNVNYFRHTYYLYINKKNCICIKYIHFKCENSDMSHSYPLTYKYSIFRLRRNMNA